MLNVGLCCKVIDVCIVVGVDFVVGFVEGVEIVEVIVDEMEVVLFD